MYLNGRSCFSCCPFWLVKSPNFGQKLLNEGATFIPRKLSLLELLYFHYIALLYFTYITFIAGAIFITTIACYILFCRGADS